MLRNDVLMFQQCTGFQVKLSRLTFRGPCIVIYSYNKTNEMH